MPRYVAFLRAINVGGRNVTMETLRGVLAPLRLVNIETFIASGNVIFETRAAPAKLEARIARVLEAGLGYPVKTMLRSFEEVRAIDAVARSLPESTAKNVGLLAAEPAAAAVQAFLKLQTPLDKLEVRGRELYWLSQVRQSESALFKVDFERLLGVALTMRGASTIAKLCAKYPA